MATLSSKAQEPPNRRSQTKEEREPLKGMTFRASTLLPSLDLAGLFAFDSSPSSSCPTYSLRIRIRVGYFPILARPSTLALLPNATDRGSPLLASSFSEVVGLFLLSLDDNKTPECFQGTPECFHGKGNGSKGYERENVGLFPLLLRARDFETLNNVGDAEGNDGVAYGLVVGKNIPVDSVLVVGLGPEEEDKSLEYC
ncbi:peptidyl tRNA hydrolase 2 mitochondrial [Striga asiatica]|uniref:Peptidyl tRNA hydrolase 2 mitochondrial n=1 Tax=Striga asiatica TaxID=4170 RepID=A0A5A7P128_STRAF|nr:peptidyl tRNA hydrolase 2 mitochondrial [Striga asiatica]